MKAMRTPTRSAKYGPITATNPADVLAMENIPGCTMAEINSARKLVHRMCHVSVVDEILTILGIKE
jgi:hypothetical protein